MPKSLKSSTPSNLRPAFHTRPNPQYLAGLDPAEAFAIQESWLDEARDRAYCLRQVASDLRGA